ncbi:MAG: cytochrome c biogenesis protein CcsA [Planctomycetota bacterium]|nr:cytochrome c biogenesis protein CcsA [Planctomycetota bacterium]
MTQAIQALGVALPVLYALSALFHGVVFAGERSTKIDPLRRNVLNATIAIHFAYFAARAVEIEQFPANDLWTTVSFIAFSTALLYAVIARVTGHSGSGGVALGLVFVLQFLSSSFGSFTPVMRAAGMNPWAITHVSLSAVAAAALALSGVHGALYLLLLREMRRRRFGAWFDHLPDLDMLAKMMRRSALFGFIGLTIGLNVGIGLAHAEKVPGFNYTHPEVLMSLLLWLHFGVIAFSEKIRGFGARRASYAAAGGLVALLLSLLLVLWPNSFHSGL